MRFRKLRIAWSVFWGVAAVLLIVLWVRSYYLFTELRVPGPKIQTLSVQSFRGRTIWSIYEIRFVHQLEWMDLEDKGDRDWTEYDEFIGSFKWISASAVKNGRALVLPLWFFVVLSAVCATVPYWLFAVRSTIARIPKRFSLRTLLIATTLVAVVLGLAVWAEGN